MILALIFLGLIIWLIVVIKGNTNAHQYPGKTKEEIKKIKKEAINARDREITERDNQRIAEIKRKQETGEATNSGLLVFILICLSFAFTLILIYKEQILNILDKFIPKLF